MERLRDPYLFDYPNQLQQRNVSFLCRSMQAYFEQWLRLMLRWDPKARGGGLSEGRPQCFKILDTVLGIKVSLSLLCTTHHKFMSDFLPKFDKYI